MMDPSSYLAQWAKNFAIHKDLIQGKIKKIEVAGNTVKVMFKENETNYFGMAELDLEKIPKNQTIVLFNTEKNFKKIVSEWKILVENKTTIIMINPKSKLDLKWVVNASLHDLVCDHASLKQGLKAMFETVEPVIEKEIAKICKD